MFRIVINKTTLMLLNQIKCTKNVYLYLNSKFIINEF